MSKTIQEHIVEIEKIMGKIKEIQSMNFCLAEEEFIIKGGLVKEEIRKIKKYVS